MIGFCYNSKRVELYDPSQARDESGKWTGSSGSTEKDASAIENSIYKEVNKISSQSEQKAKELGEEYKKDENEVKEWSKILSENTENEKEAREISKTILTYTSGGEEDTTEVEDSNGASTVVYRGAESVPAINEEGFSETLNSILRGNIEPVGERKNFEKTVEKIDKFIKIAPKNTKSEVYRGMFTRNMEHDKNGKITSWSNSDKSVFSLAKNIKDGDIISDLGFMSASESKKAARKFSGENFFDPKADSGASIFMTIKNVSGHGAKVPQWATPWREKEVIFPRGSKLKVLKVDRKEIQGDDLPDGYEKNLSISIEAELLK